MTKFDRRVRRGSIFLMEKSGLLNAHYLIPILIRKILFTKSRNHICLFSTLEYASGITWYKVHLKDARGKFSIPNGMSLSSSCLNFFYCISTPTKTEEKQILISGGKKPTALQIMFSLNFNSLNEIINFQ